ncbi:MAG: epoxyqueuosine reductase QueH [Ruminococcaceae bacterium]|nr:epoxyqueuosine reductase QueH [Oscillospiraceae bacterium]
MTNYSKMLDAKIEELEKSGTKPKLLLHACCAPCSSYTLEYLASHFDITLFFYNPNISPESEYNFRADELKRFISLHPSCAGVKLIVPKYDSKPFFEIARGLENEPERGARCLKCYRLRLIEAAKAAKEDGFDYFCTTLSISPHKNAEALNKIGNEVAEEFGVKYLYSDFKKKGGYARSIALSKEYNLYRQDYCGCIFSKIEAEKRANQ